MTDNAQIIADLASGESETREFKRQLDNLESVAGELVAFANVGGGALYLGVEDDGQVAGIPDPDATIQALTRLCRDRCIPPISPVIEQYTIDNQTVIVLAVRPEFNRQKPYRTAGGRFYTTGLYERYRHRRTPPHHPPLSPPLRP
jgi:predicted HTH transcriptional regulator